MHKKLSPNGGEDALDGEQPEDKPADAAAAKGCEDKPADAAAAKGCERTESNGSLEQIAAFREAFGEGRHDEEEWALQLADGESMNAVRAFTDCVLDSVTLLGPAKAPSDDDGRCRRRAHSLCRHLLVCTASSVCLCTASSVCLCTACGVCLCMCLRQCAALVCTHTPRWRNQTRRITHAHARKNETLTRKR